jgi:arylsulfatase A-like enzyme
MEHDNLLERTLIIYTADHGDYCMDYGLMRKGAGMPEALVRIPMVWSGWGVRRGQAPYPAFVSIADVMPTLCEAVGADIPKGVQGRSLWPLLRGEEYPKEEFRSIYSEGGFGGLFYDREDNIPLSIADFRPSTVPEEHKTTDELNPVTQSGSTKMVRMGDWKLLYDTMGHGELYHLPSDPCELKNLFGDPAAAREQTRLVEELLMWTISTQDSLPTGAYRTKWPAKHNWVAPYRNGKAARP